MNAEINMNELGNGVDNEQGTRSKCETPQNDQPSGYDT